MNKIFIPVLFVLLFAAQWFVPAQLIFQQETVLAEGTPYKFKTRPIDPSDPLRGKYITLNYDMNKVTVIDSFVYDDSSEYYVYLLTDDDGFAKASHASLEKIENGQDYVKVISNYSSENVIHFQLPFKTFYMEESKAYEAEVSVRRASRDSLPLNCYGLVYLKDDRAVLKDVIVNDMSIKDYVLQQRLE